LYPRPMTARARSAERVVVYTEATGRGGAEVSLRNLLAELDASFDVVVLGVDPSICSWIAEVRPGTAAVVVAPVRSKWSIGALLALRRRIAQLQPAIFHANLRTIGDAQYALLAAVSLRNVRVVAVEQLPYPLASRLSRRLKQWTSARLAAHIAVGARAARLVEEQAGLPAGSVQTIYNGVRDLGPAALPPPGRRTAVGTLARLDPIKGLDLLLRAAAPLANVELTLIGDGPARAELGALAAELGLADRVRFGPWADDARRHLAELDVFVLPSRNEGFPLSVVEAMLAGRPVIASDVGSVSEAVDEQTGILVPPDDVLRLRTAISELVADPARRRRLGEAGRQRALERFTAAAMARAFEALYREL
jgi:glycosyltransferase involved in cell wall biosynthesis